ncbi:MAG: GNAT family N-acetyltransferase [Deltaproteobacteria bacterium]|nr:GNAT family N-acetyltransferase [Deltaproteobacteria bacterium]
MSSTIGQATTLVVRGVPSVADLPAAAWDALDHGPSPFLKSGFLRALEESGSIDPISAKGRGKRSGWNSVYLLAELDGRLVGAVPAFIKPHSYGEYIFDWGWANAAARAGLDYYPKLVVAAPATPATGKRILLAPDLGPLAGPIREALIGAVRSVAEDTSCSSIHWLFCTQDEQRHLEQLGFFPRASYQFHWHNAEPRYHSFDDFLAALSSRKRKQLKKERARAKAAIEGLRWIPGKELDQRALDDLDRFYRQTTDNHGGRDYLRPRFFHVLAESLPEAMQMVEVTREGKRIAGALFLESEQALYGRYWGTDVHVDLLHFETAYYAGIERAIDKQLPLFEAGAQGEHKLLRGFAPSPTYSAHWLRHPGLSAAIEDHTRREAAAVATEIAELAKLGPYKTGTTED